jgi:hypothetical protein
MLGQSSQWRPPAKLGLLLSFQNDEAGSFAPHGTPHAAEHGVDDRVVRFRSASNHRSGKA